MPSTIYTPLQKRQSNFFKKVYEVHGDRYDYSNTIYTNRRNNIDVICKKHGKFTIRAGNHLYGKQGCSKCYGNETSNNKSFIKKSKNIHNNKYDYSKVEYVNNKTPVNIICPIHGVFPQRPDAHIIQKQGCNVCSRIGLSPIVKIDSIDANDICYLYTIKLTDNNETFYKTGISNNYIRRHSEISLVSGYKIELIDILIDTRYTCFKLEQKILNKYKRKLMMYKPIVKFGGWTECYKNILKST